MKVLIWGAGGIGCYYAMRLQQAGHQVSMVARGDHLTALKTAPLSVVHNDEASTFKFDALSEQELLNEHDSSDFDLIIFAFKSSSSQSVLNDAKAWLQKSDVPVLSLQNGVDNEPLIAEVVGAGRTLGGLAVRIGAHILEPGVVESRGPAQVVLGWWQANPGQSQIAFSDQLCEQMNEAGIPTRYSDQIQVELWRKLLINNGVNALSALTRLDTGQLTTDPVYTEIVYRLMKEAARAAAADGVEIGLGDIEDMYALICNFDPIKTSMLVDLEKGRTLELDAITGAVLSRLSVQQAPVTALIQRQLKD